MMEPRTGARARVTVAGRVQGVFFRAETRRIALSLKLAGWVRNVEDGTVEADFEGERERIEKAIEWCGHGPGGAVVDAMDVRWEKPSGQEGFTIRYQ